MDELLNLNDDHLEDDIVENQPTSDIIDDNQDLHSDNEPINLEDNFSDKGLQNFLKQYNIDYNSIKIEEEDGTITSVKWNELDDESKFNILNSVTTKKSDDNKLTKEELNLIQSIRQSKLSPTKYIEKFAKPNVKSEPEYKIDSYSDDEIFSAHLIELFGDISEDIILEKLNAEKQNPELYKLQVDKLRERYKKIEADKLEREAKELKETKEREFQKIHDDITNNIIDFTSLGELSLDLEDREKSDIYDFILNNESGNTRLNEYLQDPKNLVKVAWFALHGEEVIDDVIKYFRNEISKAKETSKQKSDDTKNKKNNVVITSDNSDDEFSF